MDVATVTLDEVLRASQARAASLVPETAGYLALAVGDGAARLPYRVEDRAVKLTTEGSVLVDRGKEVVAPEEAGRILRDILARLLDSSVGSMPGLASAARPRADETGMDAVIEELESALIPVNRAAARRALARLARETMRAKQSGRIRRRAKGMRQRKAPRPAPAPPAPIEAPAEVLAAPAEALDIPITVEHEPAVAIPEPPPAAAPVAAPVPIADVPIPAPARAAPEPAPEEPAPEPTPTVFEEGLVTFERSEAELAEEAALLAAADAEAAVLDAQLADPTILQVTTAVEPAPASSAAELPPAPAAEPELPAEAVVPPAPRLPSQDSFTVEGEEAPRRGRRGSRRRLPKADIVSGPKSDVEDLLNSFGESKLSAGDVRAVAAELKSMVGLDATPAPPQTAPHTIVMERPTDMDPPVIDAPPLALTSSRPGRVARAGLAFKMALLVAGIAATLLIWRFHPAIFAGHESPVAQDALNATP